MAGDELTRTELRRIAEEFKSERDAAKRDAMRAFEERDILLNRLKACEAARDALAANAQRYLAVRDGDGLLEELLETPCDEWDTVVDEYRRGELDAEGRK